VFSETVENNVEIVAKREPTDNKNNSQQMPLLQKKNNIQTYTITY